MPPSLFPTPTWITPDHPDADWPSFSRDGSTVVFFAPRYTLRTVAATGGESKYLVGDESLKATRPDWSWSPTTIAFAGTQGDVSTIWLVESDGTNLRQLPNHGSLTNTLYPSWSQNLESIVAMDGGDNQHIVLYRFSVDGGRDPLALTFYSQVCAGRPSIAPSGSQVAFAGIKGAFNQENNQIWVVTLPCLQICQLNPLQGRSPNWSPDGQWILFESNRNNPNYQLFVMAADGSGEIVALTDPEYFVQHGEWSRQQDKIVFAATGKGIGVIDVPEALRRHDLS